MLHNSFYSLLYDILLERGAKLMHIAAVSDIHARSNGLDKDLLEAIRNRAANHTPDVFIVAGDLSERLDDLDLALSSIKIENCVNLYVAGNHDIWFEEDRGLGSLEKYSKLIQEKCEENGFIHLPNTPYIQEDLAIVGSIGWYDYSFRRIDLDIPLDNYKAKQYRDSYWRDLYCVDWTFTDQEATDLLNEKLRYDLKTLPAKVRRIIYVSHHLPFKELTFYKDRLPWDFFSAFMGAVSTGEIVQNDKRIILTISGHSHIRTKLELDNLLAITVPIGYGRPEKDDLDTLADSAVAELKIDDNGVEILHFIEGDICEDLEYSF
jgi:putative phosphoesterase